MVVIVLTACPQGLRGHLTRWLFEVSAGVFVGRLNPRLREHVWGLVEEAESGKAIMAYSDRKAEQGFSFEVLGHDWTPVDLEGVTLMMRPAAPGRTSLKKGWSSASRMRRARKR
jgi:CRISPR-associated protein Cas2